MGISRAGLPRDRGASVAGSQETMVRRGAARRFRCATTSLPRPARGGSARMKKSGAVSRLAM